MLIVFVLFSVVAGALFVAGFSTNVSTPAPRKEGDLLRVAGSFAVLEDFMQKVGGDDVDYVSVIGSGTIGHNFDPTAQDIAALHGLDLFVFQGGGFDSWAEKLKVDLAADGVKVLEMSDFFDLRKSTKDEASARDDNTATQSDAEETPATETEEDEHEGGLDPHIWLDPVLAVEEIEVITRTLSEIDPAHAASYQARAASYQATLAELGARFAAGLSSCRQNAIIAAHDAYEYLAIRYGFELLPIAGISPDTEPSPAHMAELAQLAKSRNIQYIFFEGFVSPQLSETLAEEVGAQTLVLNPIEARTEQEISQNIGYVEIMLQNLQNLRLALECD